MAKRKSVFTKKHKEKLSDFSLNVSVAWFVVGVITPFYSHEMTEVWKLIVSLVVTGVFLLHSLTMVDKIKI